MPRYWPERLRRARFWAAFVQETLGRRRLARLVRLRLVRAGPVHAHGLLHLPASGAFTLAANHNGERRSLDTIAAVLAAANRARPDLAPRYLLIVGRRAPGRRSSALVARLCRRLLLYVYARWTRHVLRIPLGNRQPSISSLRRWRDRAGRQPCLVFPEGRAYAALGAMRPGSGRWLAALGVPIVPVAVWYQEGVWQVRFGAPIRWSRRHDLRDMQLGLNIAALLPAHLAPGWAAALTAWRDAHMAEAGRSS
jgi:1-acyl-sn-glycerol-3-phosphate acyltransferase